MLSDGSRESLTCTLHHVFAKVSMKLGICSVCTLAFGVAPPLHAADPSAIGLVQAGLVAQGGEANLRALKSVQWEASGYRNLLEESERPEGPYLVAMSDISETHDLASHRYRTQQTSTTYPVARFTSTLVVSNDTAMSLVASPASSGSPQPMARPGTLQQVQTARERMALSPERLLLTALDAPDLRTMPDVILQAIPQHVVTFTLDGSPASVYLNPYTHLPTAVDYSGPLAHTGFWNYLGDVTQRTYYSFWWLAKGGIHMPLQWNVEEAGLPDSMFVIRKLQINEPLRDADLEIPAGIRAQYHPDPTATDLEKRGLGTPGQAAKEIKPGIVLIPGTWNATFIQQDDGIIVLEAPISSGYSAKVMAAAKERFPHMPIKAVITTSDSWPHLAGIREYVAQGVPIYALDSEQGRTARSFTRYVGRPANGR